MGRSWMFLLLVAATITVVSALYYSSDFHVATGQRSLPAQPAATDTAADEPLAGAAAGGGGAEGIIPPSE